MKGTRGSLDKHVTANTSKMRGRYQETLTIQDLAIILQWIGYCLVR